MTQQDNLWHHSCGEGFAAGPLAETLAGPLNGDAVADLVIIGGGFTGCAAALEAAGQGASVCLLEAEHIGHGGSGRNVGLVNAGLWLPPETVMAEMGEAPGMRLLEVLGAAPQQVFDLIARHGIACEATRNGTLHLAHAPSGLRDLAERHRQGNRLGAPLQLLDAGETARRTGSEAFHGALFDPRAGTIQPLAYVRGLARAAQAAGARLHEKSPVTRLHRAGDHWVITTAQGSLRAGAVLVATNAYHLGIRAPVQPRVVTVHYCQYATDPLPADLGGSILPGGEGCWDTALVMSSVRRDAAGRVIIGGIGNGAGVTGAVHAGWARRKLAALYPALKDQPLRHGWSGKIAMTGDHIPKIVEFGPRAYAVFGYSGRGIGPGTVFGTAAARALISGDETGLPLAPVPGHHERLTALRSAWYEAGASLIHATALRR